MLGALDVGKTSLILRYVDDTFTEDFAGEIDQKVKDIEVDGKAVRLVIYDTAGQERFRTLTSSYFRNTDAIIDVYDITNKDSFNDITGHVQDGARFSPNSQKFLVGNKNDLEEEREVTTEEGQETAERLGMPFMETSALTGDGVSELFAFVAKRLVDQGAVDKPKGDVDFEKSSSSKKGCNC